MSKVLVTGSAGCIGRAVVAELRRRGHEVRGLDLGPTPGLGDFVVGSITDRMAVMYLGALVEEGPPEQV